jgi:hypothetical protein
METRYIGLEQFLENILPAIVDQTREVIGELDVISGTHPALGKVAAIQGITSAVLITSER